MELNLSNGELVVKARIRLFPGMRRKDLLSQNAKWEIWTSTEAEPISYRTVLPVAGSTDSRSLIIVVFFAPNDGPMMEWNLFPIGEFDGVQKKREGKQTRVARTWFKKTFGVGLPLTETWGCVDAVYDPHNLITLIIFRSRNVDEKAQ